MDHRRIFRRVPGCHAHHRILRRKPVLERVERVTEWIADGLLMLIGANMVREAFSNDGDDAKQQDLLAKMDVRSMSVLALTMSLDALAVDVSLALGHRLVIWWAALSAALVSLAITVPAMFAGHRIGHKIGSKGGAILILLGLFELLQYYKVL
ncbi:manganese efflux pump MntP [Bifidobacterium choerinum]|uniref:manganese efflux pump MntP n=1 Tax=Bifidobacterium choerinum TaxID=35760 RepID=UPI000AE448BF|nr:manganese efflux pump [Bifidobacterium choerinum]